MCARLKRQKKTFTDNKVHMNDASYSGELRCSSLVLYVDSEGVYVYVDRRRHMGSSLSKEQIPPSSAILSSAIPARFIHLVVRSCGGSVECVFTAQTGD